MSDPQTTIAEMDRALHVMLDENEARRGLELARVRGRLDALMTALTKTAPSAFCK